jgi:kynureninase
VNRAAAEALDAADPLAPLRDEFETADGLLYLDGNSLGRLPKRTVATMARTVEQEWGVGLVGSWPTDWVTLPARVGDRLAPLIGAAAGEVLISDQTSLNLFKLASAGLHASARSDIITDATNFPSDLYILDGIASARGGRLRVIEPRGQGPVTAAEVTATIDEAVGLVSLSHVDYRSSALADMGAITAAAHGSGALALWDLSHSVGVYPVDLSGCNADLAVGCTYKYLNGGPGAPGFLYVRSDLQDSLQQPIHGWFGHADQFAFDAEYRAASGITRFSVGTPPIVSLRGTESGIEITGEVGVAAIRAKSVALTSLLIALYDERLADLEVGLRSPRDHEGRGGHVGFIHPSAWQITQALLDRDLVPDFRAPEVIRLGPAPLYTRFVDIWDAVEIIRDVVATGAYREYPEGRRIVT